MKEEDKNKIKEIIKKYKKENIRYAKPLDFFLSRNEATKEEIENDLLLCEDLNSAFKQERNGELRYLLYFVYNKKRGRVYVIKINDELSVITIFPIGRQTLLKSKKRKFIK